MTADRPPDQPQVSVLLPVYNAEKTLPVCLKSLAAQDHPSFEVLLIDDGSTDGSSRIMARRASADKRFRLINQDHRGIVAALNAGIVAARGSYLARMDADDRCLPERLRLQAELLDGRPEIGVCSCLVAPFPGEKIAGGFRNYFSWINGLIEPEKIYQERFCESPIPHPSAMLRADLLKEAGGYREVDWPEDYDLWLRLMQDGVRLAKVPQVLLYWRDDPQRLSRKDRRYAPEAFSRARAFYLAQGPLKNDREVIVWGAGRVARKRAEFLKAYGIRIVAWVDVDPAKIGKTFNRVPVIGPDELIGYPDLKVLSYVGNRGARERIREYLSAAGYPDKQFILCC